MRYDPYLHWLRLVQIHKRANPELRAGQAGMVALEEVDAELYGEIKGTELDVFYNDDKLLEFGKKVQEELCK